jgi:hypothetical protein
MTTHQRDIPHFEPARYPRTYGLSRGMQRLLVPMGLFILGLGVAGSIYFGVLAADILRARAVGGVLCVLFAALGLYLFLSARRYKVILGADGIKLCELLRHRQLNRDNILGRRHFVSKAGSGRWILVPKNGFGRKLELSMFLQTDRDFSAWILSLPDLDRDRKDAENRENADAISAINERGYGERAQGKLRQVASWLYGGAYALGIAIFLVPDPYHVLTWTAVTLPWLAIAAVAKFKPFYRFGGPNRSYLPDLSPPLFIPGLFLALKAMKSMSTVDWHSVLTLTILGAFLVVGAAFYVDPWLRKHSGAAALLALICCGYGYGAGLEANALLDHSAPRTYSVTVLSKRISRGKSTSYYLGVPAWGPHQSGEDVTVSGRRYQNTRVGDTVCILLRPGAFGVGWYVLASCGNELNNSSHPISTVAQ